MPQNQNDKFTFFVDDKEYVINKKSDTGEKKKSGIHGPSIAIGAAITAICVITIFSLNYTNVEQQALIETEFIETKTVSDPSQISLEMLFDNSSPILGDPNAPITLIEFGDFQCHFCNVHFKNTEPIILENFVKTGKVNIIFKDYTIIGKDSVSAAHATHCAEEQGKYWEYHHVLYNNWTGENNGWAAQDNLIKYANSIGLDSELFIECMNSSRYTDNIRQSSIDAEKLGLTGTPAFFIYDKENNNVQYISGAQPFESFERVFNSILKK